MIQSFLADGIWIASSRKIDDLNDGNNEANRINSSIVKYFGWIEMNISVVPSEKLIIPTEKLEFV